MPSGHDWQCSENHMGCRRWHACISVVFKANTIHCIIFLAPSVLLAASFELKPSVLTLTLCLLQGPLFLGPAFGGAVCLCLPVLPLLAARATSLGLSQHPHCHRVSSQGSVCFRVLGPPSSCRLPPGESVTVGAPFLPLLLGHPGTF